MRMKKEKDLARFEAVNFINSMMIVSERNNIDFDWFISEVIRSVIVQTSLKSEKGSIDE